MVILCVILILPLIASSVVPADERSMIEWTKQLDELRRVFGHNYITEEIQSVGYSTGTSNFNVTFTSLPEKATVHNLRPHDIEVVAALGDSITAGTGEDAETFSQLLIQYRGITWTAGGEETLESSLTIPNILRRFNPGVKGYSVGRGFGVSPREDEDWFNVAIPGARANDMPDQARELIRRMKNDDRTSFDHDWKLVSMFIGINDLCSIGIDPAGASSEAYRDNIEEALDILHNELPRALVQIIQIMEIYLLPQVSEGFGASRFCKFFQRFACGHVVESVGNEDTLLELREINWNYQDLIVELVANGKYDTRDDFSVIIQPLFKDSILPYTKDGEVDATFFAPDCFHFSSKGHAAGALNLWNNMLEPLGNKSTVWNISDLLCPTEEQPFLYTRLNSPVETTVAETVAHTTITAACPQVICKDTPDWAIGVMSALGVVIGLQLLALLIILQR